MTGEAGAVRAGALNADARDTAVPEPAQQICVAVGVGANSAVCRSLGDMDVLVGVDPAEYLGSVLCHDGNALWSSNSWGHHRPHGGQNTHGVGFKAPIRSRPPDRSVRALPSATSRQIYRKASRRASCQAGDPSPARPQQSECCK